MTTVIKLFPAGKKPKNKGEDKPAKEDGLHPVVKAAVRNITEAYRKSPKKWTFDSLAYTPHFEDAIQAARNADQNPPQFNVVAADTLRELYRRRKAGKIICRIKGSKD